MLGPFEEEEEGTGIASDVVKVMGEDPDTPGLLPKGIDPGTVTIPQYRVNKTKQHTLIQEGMSHLHIWRETITPVAGLIFETKNRAIFLERFFWRDFSGEKLLPVQLCSH